MTHDIPMLNDLLVVILFSLPVLFLFRRLGLTPVAGFIVTGILIGPHGMGLVSSLGNVEIAAEIGVVLLLFMVGLELSLSGLLKNPWRVYVIAVLQVAVTSFVGYTGAMMFGLSFGASVVIGFALALSSSAIVLKGLADRGELSTPLGRGVVTVCVTQDFAIVPMMVIVGILITGHTDLKAVGEHVMLVIGLVGILYLFGRYLLPALMNWMVGMRSPEVFLLFTILVLLGTCWATSLAGLSLALGAFAAGLILADNEYSAQIFSEVVPFRSLFSSLFFVSIGMLLNLQFVATHFAPVVIVAVGVIIVKMLIVLLISKGMGVSLRESIQGGFYLAQIGEFSFLLMTVALTGNLIEQTAFQYFIAASGLSLAATPLIMQLAPHIAWHAHAKLVSKAETNHWKSDSRPSRQQPAVLIIGYGVNGHNVARVLREAGIYYEILDTNPETVRTARLKGEHVHYGDVARSEVLRHIRFEEFDSAVIAISEAEATRRAVSIMRGLNPKVHIIARTRYVSEVEELDQLGANVVVPEEFETSLRIFAELLAHYRIPPHIIAVQMDLVRRRSYGLLRHEGRAEGVSVELQSLLMKRLIEAVPIMPDSAVIGKTLGGLGFSGEDRCSVIAVIRGACPLTGPYENTIITANDLIVLYGDHASLDAGVAKFT
jgi:CPA2 family monovalent cation:H+ antiporter-2